MKVLILLTFAILCLFPLATNAQIIDGVKPCNQPVCEAPPSQPFIEAVKSGTEYLPQPTQIMQEAKTTVSSTMPPLIEAIKTIDNTSTQPNNQPQIQNTQVYVNKLEEDPLEAVAQPGEVITDDSFGLVKRVRKDQIITTQPSNSTNTPAEPPPTTCESFNAYLGQDGVCKCGVGYGYSVKRGICVKVSVIQPNIQTATTTPQIISSAINNDDKQAPLIQPSVQKGNHSEEPTNPPQTEPQKPKSVVSRVFNRVVGWFARLFR